jgi:hypothetical protein
MRSLKVKIVKNNPLVLAALSGKPLPQRAVHVKVRVKLFDYVVRDV